MKSIKVTFIQTDGVQKVVEDALLGESLMELARLEGVEGIMGDCGGGCACATCHVYVDPLWQDAVGHPDDIEEMALDMAADIRKENSRLCCQIRIKSELDGLIVTVAPSA